MKKILYITYDGLMDPVAQSQVLPYLKGLSNRGFGISVISFEKKERMGAGKGREEVKAELEKNGITWGPLKYHRSPAIPATVYDIIKGSCSALSSIRKGDVGAVHARGYIPALIGLFLKRVAGKRLIFDMRGFWPDEKVDAGAWEKGSPVYALFKKIERMLIKGSDEIVVLAGSAERSLKKDFPGAAITVIPCCVDTGFFGPKPRGDILPGDAMNRPVLIYLGSTGTFYDLDGMALFFKALKEKIRGAYFWLVTNSAAGEVEGVILGHGIDRHDFAVTGLSRKDIPLALSSSALSIMFYKRRLSSAGCSPIKFAESLSCGLPVVINSGIGDTEEVINRENVGVVADLSGPGGIEEAAVKASGLLPVSEGLRKKCVSSAKEYFSLEQGIDKYSMIYRRLT
ncbi:MAG: glycosyltransferase [Candidatus Omnitrophica bacterium]|nr:glycosyltransferase [Candidatus Omnitrophota bacterium]MDD5545962.1 glycosyltransferase [Candidatus Omnitrophota bacterium]